VSAKLSESGQQARGFDRFEAGRFGKRDAFGTTVVAKGRQEMPSGRWGKPGEKNHCYPDFGLGLGLGLGSQFRQRPPMICAPQRGQRAMRSPPPRLVHSHVASAGVRLSSYPLHFAECLHNAPNLIDLKVIVWTAL